MAANNEEVILLRNLEEVVCERCEKNVSINEGVILVSCLHTFCKKCFIATVVNSPTPVVKCPLECTGIVQDYEIRFFGESIRKPAFFEMHMTRSLEHAQKANKHFYKCGGENCTGTWFMDTAERKGLKFAFCPVCQIQNCLACRTVHEGLTCKQFQYRKKTALKRKREEGVEEEDENAAKMEKIFGEGDQEVVLETSENWGKLWEQMCSNYQRLHQTNSDTIENVASADGETEQDNGAQGCNIMIPNYEFECPICMVVVPIGEGVALLDCYHTFCKTCLVSTVEHSEHPQVPCPYVGDVACPFYIQDREVKAFCPQDILDNHLKRFVTQAEMKMKNSFHCCTQNCTNWCELERGAQEFRCSICEKVNCVKCKAIHEAVSCAEYQAELSSANADEKSEEALKNLIKRGKAMNCPQCGILIQKNTGCDSIVCRVCKTHICWATKGFRWGPKGVGDTSGGCGCRSKRRNFKLCHPACRNCH